MSHGRRLVAVVVASTLTACGSAPPAPRPVLRPAAIPLNDVDPAPETYTDEDLAQLGYVLDDAAAVRYLAAALTERAEMMRIAWASLDPTPTTERNERKEAHYRRLAYAREHFASKRPPGWDRRGELLIRYGSPDFRDVSIGSVHAGQRVIPPGEFWVYATLGMAFRLEDPLQHNDFRDAVDWISGNIPGPGAGPIDVGMSMSGGGGSGTEADIARNRITRMIDNGTIALHDDTNSYDHDHGGAKLDFVFDVLDFAGEEAGKTTVEVNFLLAAKDLRYPEGDGRLAAELDVAVVAKDRDFREVGRREHVLRSSRRPDEALEYVLDRVRLDLDPGDYRLALQVQDRASGNIGIYTTEARVRRFPPGELSVSDIQLAMRVERTSSIHRFAKGEWLVVPNPAGQAAAVGSANIYFEIYGLALTRRGNAAYNVALSVRPRREDGSAGGEVRGVGTEYPGVAGASTAQESIEFDLAALSPGPWEIAIEVTDLVNDRVARGSRLLRIVETDAAGTP